MITDEILTSINEINNANIIDYYIMYNNIHTQIADSSDTVLTLGTL